MQLFSHIDQAALMPSQGVNLLICKTAAQAEQLTRLLATTVPHLPRFFFPDWETLPYDRYAPSPHIISERLDTLYRIRHLKTGVIVSSIDACLSRLCPPAFIDAHALMVNVGDELPLDDLAHRLTQAGFAHVNQVTERGQFSRRGAVLDIFPPSAKLPIRLDYFDDEIDGIRIFDVKTQLSAAKIEQVEIIPSREVDLSDAGRTCFRQSMRQLWGEKAESHALYQRLSEGREHYLTGGLEYFLPLFFDETVSFFDYLPSNVTLCLEKGAKTYLSTRLQHINQRYNRARGMGGSEPLPPENIYYNKEQWLAFLPPLSNTEEGQQLQMTKLAIKGSSSERLAQLQKLLDGQTPCLLFCRSEGEREHLLEKLPTTAGLAHLNTPPSDWLNAPMPKPHQLSIGYFPRSYLWAQKNASVTERCYLLAVSEFFSQIATDEDIQEASLDPMALINDLSQIDIGTPIVHDEHGVGRYGGLELIELEGETNEYITIRYADNGKLFIPVTDLDHITRYTGTTAENAPLHRLDGKQWAKAKAKAQEKIHDTAAELLEIYAKRAKSTGEEIVIDNDELKHFAEGFAFAPTPDQTQAFSAVYADLEKKQPMDRIVCGDVGFGKTEVALRAAFAVANAGKQVAVLVPTTLLAEQHLKNFEDRFAGYAINVAGLSRFKTATEQKKNLALVKTGAVDIVIGTHRLIQKDVHFKQLGLVIIDEEHKFGVKQKEKLKALRSDVNILTLTATPIPRTLSMSLSGLRDLSIIASPPPKRTPVETIFTDFDEDIITEGVARETARGGQVYFLHNDVATMGNMEARLQKMFPRLNIRHAHGQMPEKQLENIMRDFHQQHFDVLLTTTIVESGIDNPNANTIFINRADKFGLAQLHQLRGRVGRSSHQAYAYLITPGQTVISRDAQKRLSAFAALKGLGVGFMLASQDMEIRGAGELLGDNQSGQITEIGFSLFNEMLEETVDAMKNNRHVDFNSKHNDVDIDLGMPALIPDAYIHDVHLRLVQYKRIASCQTESELDQLQIEFIDRFGLLPSALKVLFKVFEIKLLAKQMGVIKLVADDSQIVLTLAKNHRLDGEKLIQLIQKQPMKYKPQRDSKGMDKLTITEAIDSWDKRGAFILNWLKPLLKID